jgi:hypothetical protein
MNRSRSVLFGVAAGVMVSACSSSPSQPASVVAGAASIVAGASAAPANGAVIGYGAQPLTLAVQNAVVTQAAAGAATYTFEVATDAAFVNKVQTKDGVAQGANGQTSVKLDVLAGGKDYFWHARAQGGGTTGVFGAAFKFTLGPQVSIGAPVIVAPLSGAQTVGSPTFTVTNVTRSGPVGPITYRFDIADSAAFSTIVLTRTVAEGGAGQTSFTPPSDLTPNKTFFWRVVALDVANAASSTSVAQTFVTSLVIDLSKVIYLKGPDLSTWKQTGIITNVEQDGNVGLGGPMCISFTDPGWPDTPWIYAGPNDPPGFGIYGNQWYFANINGQWYGGPGEWLYRGAATCKAGQGTTTIGRDSGFGEPFSSWVPKVGELVGYAVSASARALPAMSTVQERTNVVLVPWRDSSIQGFTSGSQPAGVGVIQGLASPAAAR